MNNINGLGNILNHKLEQNENAQDLKLRESAKQLELSCFIVPLWVFTEIKKQTTVGWLN